MHGLSSISDIYHYQGILRRKGLQFRAAKMAAVLWEKRSADVAEVASAFSLEAPSSTAYPAGTARKHKLGKNILEDYETVNIGQSAYFTGEQSASASMQLVTSLLLSQARHVH
jgi:hypothetical protein